MFLSKERSNRSHSRDQSNLHARNQALQAGALMLAGGTYIVSTIHLEIAVQHPQCAPGSPQKAQKPCPSGGGSKQVTGPPRSKARFGDDLLGGRSLSLTNQKAQWAPHHCKWPPRSAFEHTERSQNTHIQFPSSERQRRNPGPLGPPRTLGTQAIPFLRGMERKSPLT